MAYKKGAGVISVSPAPFSIGVYMNYSEFKSYLREFCGRRRVEFPSIKERHKLHKEYDDSLYTAPIEDCKETLEQFFMSTFCIPSIALAPLPKAVPASYTSWKNIKGCKADMIIIDDVIKEEGKTPMRYNDNYASASANVTTVQSDAAIQRDYLLGRLSKAEWPKQQSFTKLFNLNVDNTPKTYKELIDVIKNGKFTLDPKATKKVDKFTDGEDDSNYPEGYNPYGAFFGIVWEGLNPDVDGYKAALLDMNSQFTAAKDVIMTGDAAAGLKALQDFEAWVPTTKAN